MAPYVRTQIYLEDAEHRRLKREAAERGISLTEHIRRLLEAPHTAAGSSVGERAATYGDDPFAGLIGMFASDPDGPWHHESPKEEASAAWGWLDERKQRRSVDAIDPEGARAAD